MASTTSERLWRVTKAAGRPFPQLSNDDVMDYLITEAVALKVQRQDREAQESAQAAAEMKQQKAAAIANLQQMVN